LISDSCSNKAIEAWDRDPSRFAFGSGKGPESDGIAGENSPFADGIIRQLRNNDQDAINIVRLAVQVTEEIRYNYDQQAEVSPLQGAGHKGGQYIFFKKGNRINKKTVKKIKIFLASSNELKAGRDQFEIEIYRKCKNWLKRGSFFI